MVCQSQCFNIQMPAQEGKTPRNSVSRNTVVFPPKGFNSILRLRTMLIPAVAFHYRNIIYLYRQEIFNTYSDITSNHTGTRVESPQRDSDCPTDTLKPHMLTGIRTFLAWCRPFHESSIRRASILKRYLPSLSETVRSEVNGLNHYLLVTQQSKGRALKLTKEGGRLLFEFSSAFLHTATLRDLDFCDNRNEQNFYLL